MSVQVYLRWDDMTQCDKDGQNCIYWNDEDPHHIGWTVNYGSGWMEGYAGFLHDFNGGTPTHRLLSEYYVQGSDAPPVKGIELLKRLSKVVPMLEELERDDYLHKLGSYIGFITRVCELEAEGRAPCVYVSW